MSEVPRLVHVVVAPDAEVENATSGKEEATYLTTISSAVNVAPLQARVPLRATVSLAVEIPLPHTGRPEASVFNTYAKAPASEPFPAPSSLASSGSISRSEEVITEPRRVTRIVRFEQPTGTVHEYRKVVHAFDGVYYFQDGVSITERTFAEAVNEEPVTSR